MKITGAVSAALVAVLTVPLLAHHSFATEYDRTKPVSVTGVVKKMEWKNPHIWFYVDVKDARGKVVTWGFSGGLSPHCVEFFCASEAVHFPPRHRSLSSQTNSKIFQVGFLCIDQFSTQGAVKIAGSSMVTSYDAFIRSVNLMRSTTCARSLCHR
ncbi:MAG: hypothetical protein DMF87_21975, partial [Acidobacteria bacterium]